MLRGVRVVEGADLERLCGATHRGFESLPLSQADSNLTNTAISELLQDKNNLSSHNCDTIAKNYDTALRLYKVRQTFYYRRRHKQKLFRISLRTKNLKVALHRKRLIDLIEGEELFKLKTEDYEMVFEYDTAEELETYLKLAQETQEKIQEKKNLYLAVNSRVEKQAEKDFGKYLNFIDLEFKFVEAKKKADKVSPATYRAYASTFKKLAEYFYKKEVSNILIEDYEDFRDFLAKKHELKNKTINNHITYTSKFLDFAVSRKLIKENNLKGIESLKEEDVDKDNFTDEDIANIFAYEYEQSIKDYFTIAAYSGMRSGEIHQLANKDIIKEKDMYIFDIKDSKTKAGLRKVPIHQDILEQVLKMDFPIFKNKTKDAAQKTLNRRLYKVIDKDSTKSFHTFRATFVEKAVNAHPDKIAVVQEIVGHSKNEKDKLTIDTYAKGFALKVKQPIVNSVKYN